MIPRGTARPVQPRRYRTFGPEQTEALLREVPAAYQTQINDVLLTALVQAYAAWSGQGSLLVDLEGHGREELFDDVDLSRTVGWFTTLYPVRLRVAGSGFGRGVAEGGQGAVASGSTAWHRLWGAALPEPDVRQPSFCGSRWIRP